jgi:hypothetical protein
MAEVKPVMNCLNSGILKVWSAIMARLQGSIWNTAEETKKTEPRLAAPAKAEIDAPLRLPLSVIVTAMELLGAILGSAYSQTKL